MIRALHKPKGRAFWIAAALIAVNEIRGLVVVAAILLALSRTT
jgi:hypothetical protein